jgi:hypothetical protein
MFRAILELLRLWTMNEVRPVSGENRARWFSVRMPSLVLDYGVVYERKALSNYVPETRHTSMHTNGLEHNL